MTRADFDDLVDRWHASGTKEPMLVQPGIQAGPVEFEAEKPKVVDAPDVDAPNDGNPYGSTHVPSDLD